MPSSSPLLLWVAALTSACSAPPGTSQTPPDGPPQVTVRADLPPQAAAPEAPPVPAPPALSVPSLGFASAPDISQSARNHNRKGLEHHRAKRYREALAAFEAAIERSPDHDMARFNRACALGRLGRHDEAAAEADTLLLRDRVRFQPRLWNDPDLQATRESPAWQAVSERRLAVERAFAEAMPRAIPGLFYKYESPFLTPGKPNSGTRNLVAGLYVHNEGRFLPVSHGGFTALVDTARARVLTVDSFRWEGVVHAVYRSSSIRIHSFAPGVTFDASSSLYSEAPTVLGVSELAPKEFAGEMGFEKSWTITSTDEGAWVDLLWIHGSGSARNRLSMSPEGLLRTKVKTADGLHLRMRTEGAVFQSPAPSGHDLRGRSYTPPDQDTLQLDRRHRSATWQSLVQDASGRYVFITSVRHHQPREARDEHEGRLDHIVERIDLHTQTHTVFSAGPGPAHTVLGPDGAVYVDGTAVRRWPQAGAALEEATDVMRGLRLAPPLDPINCGLCD